MAESRTHVYRRRRAKHARSRPRVRQNRSILLVLGLIGGFALGLLVLAGGPRIIKTWQKSHYISRAEENLKQGKFSAAIDSAQQALRFDQDSLAAFRILAEATEKQNQPETVRWRGEIARLTPREVDSQLNLASAALRFGQLDVARKALENVPKESRDSAAYNVVAGWLARAQGDEAGVDRHFAAAVEKEPKNELYQFNLAALRIKSPDPQKSASARESLERLAKVAPYRAGSLRALLSDAVTRTDLAAAERYAQELQMTAQVTFSDYLLCLDFYKKLDEKKFAALLDKVKPVAARLSSDLALLLAWMNDNGMAAEVLRWTEKLPAEKTTSPPVAIEIANALTLQKGWSRLRRWTRSGSWNEYEYLRLAYRAYAVRQTRQSSADAEFGSLWRAADRASEENPEREIRLARLASKWNLPTEAEQLWLRVAQNPLTRREALDALFDIYRATNDLPNLYLTAMRLHEASPDEPLLAAEYARLSLVLDRNAKEGQRVAQEAFEQAPSEPLCVAAQALSLYSLGRTAEGIELLRKLAPEKLHQPHTAVYAAILLLDQGQLDAAHEFVDAAEGRSIYAEEKKLLQEALQKAQSIQTVEPATQAPAPSPSATANAMPSPAPVDLSPR